MNLPSEAKRIYIAQFTPEKYAIASFEVISESEKQYQLNEKSRELVEGGHVHCSAGRINKSTYHIFPTLVEAQCYCMDEARKSVDFYERKLARALEMVEAIKATIAQSA